jgi:hypothetical protein
VRLALRCGNFHRGFTTKDTKDTKESSQFAFVSIVSFVVSRAMHVKNAVVQKSV